MVDKIIAERIYSSFIKPLQFWENSIDGFIELIWKIGSDFSIMDIELDCLLINLAKERASIDEGFWSRLVQIYE